MIIPLVRSKGSPRTKMVGVFVDLLLWSKVGCGEGEASALFAFCFVFDLVSFAVLPRFAGLAVFSAVLLVLPVYLFAG